MRRFCHRYRSKSKLIIGTSLVTVGVLIIINFIPIEFLLVLIGIGLLIMGGLILKLK